MRCYKCGNNLPPDSKFCQYCGEDLSNVKFCSFCGFQLKDGMKFCPQCGKDIRAIAPTLEDGHQDKKTCPDDPAVPSVGVDARDIPEPTTMEESAEKVEKSSSSPSDDSLVHKAKKKWLLVILVIIVGIIVGIFLWSRDTSYQKSEADTLEENTTIPQTDLGDVNQDKGSLTDRLYEKTTAGEKSQSDESAFEAHPDYDRSGTFDRIDDDTPKASGSIPGQSNIEDIQESEEIGDSQEESPSNVPVEPPEVKEEKKPTPPPAEKQEPPAPSPTPAPKSSTYSYFPSVPDFGTCFSVKESFFEEETHSYHYYWSDIGNIKNSCDTIYFDLLKSHGFSFISKNETLYGSVYIYSNGTTNVEYSNYNGRICISIS